MDIYKIKIHVPTLRELMLMQSLYSSKTISDVTELVGDQPSYSLFFKVFLELGMKPLVSYLAFDKNSIALLLKCENHKDIDQDYPVFYKNADGRSAIDNAIDLN